MELRTSLRLLANASQIRIFVSAATRLFVCVVNNALLQLCVESHCIMHAHAYKAMFTCIGDARNVAFCPSQTCCVYGFSSWLFFAASLQMVRAPAPRDAVPQCSHLLAHQARAQICRSGRSGDCQPLTRLSPLSVDVLLDAFDSIAPIVPKLKLLVG